MQECSRHKSTWKPADTPESFWNLDILTPEEWKKPKKKTQIKN